MNFYDKWIDLVKKSVPSPDNQEEMTASIMGKIENLPVGASSNKIRYITSFLSGTVACCLFCLMIYEFNRPLHVVQEKQAFSATNKQLLPEKIEDIPVFLKEKERRANFYSELRLKMAQNYSH